MSDDTDKTEDKVVIFNKRFSSTAPVVPTWHVVYYTTEGNVEETFKTGYITSLMPLFMISSNKDSKDINDTLFAVPTDRVVIYERGSAEDLL